jgi:hypothetical protein
MDARQKSFNQLTADKVNKRDLVINFRKPTACQLSLVLQGASDGLSFLPQARGIIRDYLSSSPGATKDRIYDELVSRMVRLGTMEAHDFDGLLQQVAEAVRSDGERLDRWYLRETELAIEDAAESAKEDGAAASFHEFITAELRQHAGEEGVHYSDLFEHYVYAVKDKPRRLLAEWLPDYFFKTEVGTWRLPASAEEEQLKASARAGGLSRRIKRYLAFLAQGVAVPDRERPSDATLAEWIRHSKRAGFYEQGRELYEHGGLNLDGLSEEAMVNVEEDYQVCVRMLGRVGQGDGKAPKRRGKGPGAQGGLFQ